MTMDRERHETFEELISASLAGDLTDQERRRLDAHLDGCERCRTTLAAFSDQRRIMSGLRHVAPPRDLGARVRTGIERGALAGQPWWRRPAVILAGLGGSLAAVAGALLAIVLLNSTTQAPPVGQATPSPTASLAGTPEPTLPPPFPTGASPAPTATMSSPASPEPAASAAATPGPSPEPDLYLALTGPYDNLALTVREGATGETIMELDTPSGPPIAAELSPDGQWLAYITAVGQSGLNEVRATRVAEAVPSENSERAPAVDSPINVGGTVVLGESVAGSPFLEQLFWSPNSRYLTYTLAEPEAGGTDAWMLDLSVGEPRPLTDAGNAYAASWVPGSSGTLLAWLSTAGPEPVSYLHAMPAENADGVAMDPSDDAMVTAEGVFQPLLSPNGSLAIYWNGGMDRSGDEWIFVSGGQPYLAEHTDDFDFDSERPMFRDLSVGRDAFASAAATWGRDGDAYSVWSARWTGLPQELQGEAAYPDPDRVYFGRATDARGLTRVHAIDPGDIPEGSSVVDVKISPTGEHLVITALRPIGGVLEAPRADLLLVERNTGNEPDDVRVIRSADDGWFGPAAFDD